MTQSGPKVVLQYYNYNMTIWQYYNLKILLSYNHDLKCFSFHFMSICLSLSDVSLPFVYDLKTILGEKYKSWVRITRVDDWTEIRAILNPIYMDVRIWNFL